jgi:ElaB/YqjD/DUF883 family membrane-anchored ribosome-binding protein
MDEQRTGAGGAGHGGSDRDLGGSSAGRANTPRFDRDTSGGTEDGRPPSHREYDEGRLGQGGSSEQMEGIALNREGKTETQRVLEETRDEVAKKAAPVVAEKMQEAIAETSEQLSGTLSEQAKKTAEAVRHDAERLVGEKAAQVRERVEGRVDEAMDRTANRLGDAANRLHETADRRLAGEGTVRSTARRWTHDVADAGESAAGFLRETDMHDLTQRLERRVREQPLQTLLMAAAAGWLVGKILR